MKYESNGENSSSEYENPLFQAISELDKSQKQFFDAARDWVKTPSAKKLNNFNTSLEANGNAFYDVVTEITASDEAEPEEKSLQLATLLINTDKDRVEFFRQIAPEGKFARMPETRLSITDKILNKFEIHDDLDTICFEIVNNYANHLNADTTRLLESVQTGGRLKMLQYAEKAKENAGHIGKISLGVAIGSIIANRIVKKLDK